MKEKDFDEVEKALGKTAEYSAEAGAPVMITGLKGIPMARYSVITHLSVKTERTPKGPAVRITLSDTDKESGFVFFIPVLDPEVDEFVKRVGQAISIAKKVKAQA